MIEFCIIRKCLHLYMVTLQKLENKGDRKVENTQRKWE